MDRDRIEQLILIVGGTAIMGALALSFAGGDPDPVEVLGQFMLFGVLVAAVRFGRRGGFVAALAASIAYVVLRIPLLAEGPVSPEAFAMLTLRLAAYGLVGIVGGEICSRIQYVVAELAQGNAIDEWSKVFNERHAHDSLVRARGRFARYDEQFSVVIVTLSRSLTAGMRPAAQRKMVRAVAGGLRNDVRLVDEVARLADGRLVAILPHTPKEGALVVRERLVASVRQTLGAREEAVSAEAIAAPEDLARIDGLIEATRPAEDDQEALSGTYRSAAPSTLKPAAASASSAAGSSTLNTSTAASPEGSTKQ